jgi:CRP/FNR family transcriptional regulator, cyclic AMP receptor protein
MGENRLPDEGAHGGGGMTLPDRLVPQLLARTRPMRVRAGQILIAEGTASDDVFYIIDGQVQVSVLSTGGWETIFRFMGTGELVGELAAIDGAERSASVVATQDGQLASLRAAEFRRFLAEVPEAGFWMARQLTHRVRELSQRLFEMATLPIGGRLAAELLRQPGHRDGDRLRLDALSTHAEIASRIGTNRETVTKELRILTERGLLLREGRTIIVPSVASLQGWVSELCR